MKDAEALLKEQIKAGPTGVYLLYGEEPYLVDQYARQLQQRTVADPEDVFNCQRLDGEETTPEQLEQAVTMLPVMAEKICVTVRDMDLAACSDRIVALMRDLPDTCVLIFRQVSRQPDRRKKSWQAVLKQVEAAGLAVSFARRSPAQLQQLLVSGAGQRGCRLDARGAALLAELQTTGGSRKLYRELGRYAVSVYDQHFQALYTAGALLTAHDVPALDENSAILNEPSLYSETMGLSLEPESGQAKFV